MSELEERRRATVTLGDIGPSNMPPEKTPSALRVAVRRIVTAAIVGAAIVIAWSLLARSTIPEVLPGPALVWSRFLTSISDGTYLPAFLTTLNEAALGWLLAAVIALPLGYALGLFRTLEDALAPYLAGSQAMPVVAIAPLLVIWLGVGLLPKVVVCALIAFFPMLATTAAGIRGVPRDLRDAARVFGASALPLALHVDLPLAARTMFAGMKVAAALSVTGAVVGEFVSSDQGLGWMIQFGLQSLQTSLMFVALISLIVLGALAYTAVSLVERFVLRWDD
ncbi:MAG: ABC transporter permease [Chloroflexota bacterium]|nr:ABC transporter permease [Chloroflexota bacterium]